MNDQAIVDDTSNPPARCMMSATLVAMSLIGRSKIDLTSVLSKMRWLWKSYDSQGNEPFEGDASSTDQGPFIVVRVAKLDNRDVCISVELALLKVGSAWTRAVRADTYVAHSFLFELANHDRNDIWVAISR